jgi:hypothetical protein
VRNDIIIVGRIFSTENKVQQHRELWLRTYTERKITELKKETSGLNQDEEETCIYIATI